MCGWVGCVSLWVGRLVFMFICMYACLSVDVCTCQSMCLSDCVGLSKHVCVAGCTFICLCVSLSMYVLSELSMITQSKKYNFF